MHRRNLILRRFGALSFGIGYFEDGVWVDHAAEGPESLAGADPAMRAIHESLRCCMDERRVIPIEAAVIVERAAVAVRSASS
jgi:hypothetical protein